MKTLIVIPVRMASKRFPNKPMALIKGKPMVQRVWEQAISSALGDVVVACCEKEVFNLIKSLGGDATMTPPELPSGTDRVFAVIKNHPEGRQFDSIINLQGDMPTISPNTINSILDYKQLVNSDIYTLATKINNSEEKHDPNVVKVVISKAYKKSFGKALYFSSLLILPPFSVSSPVSTKMIYYSAKCIKVTW